MQFLSCTFAMHDHMPDGKPSNDQTTLLFEKLAAELQRGQRLIASIDDTAYRLASKYTGTLGAHFRHNLDIAKRLLEGIESAHVDYGKRERNTRIESDRTYAIGIYDEVIRRVRNLSADTFSMAVKVRSEVDSFIWLPSSVGREVEYVHNHTVHHHALIAEKLSAARIELDKDFGVAPSTLEYRAGKKG